MGLSIDVRDKWERTPLHWAVVNGHGKAVGVLLEAGANSKVTDDHICHPGRLCIFAVHRCVHSLAMEMRISCFIDRMF